jgi:site-specific DNA-methyltransferase (adenine-specific)
MSEIETDVIHTGDCFDVVGQLPDNSVHAVVTDPPYGLAFMGKSWDDFEPKEYQQWCEKWASKVLRVLKPGGHLLAFSGNRTHHRLFTGVGDAGFEIRDTITWHYGGGFPKNNDTQLKPATEYVVMGRKKYDGTVSDCVDEHGTGKLNIYETRVGGGSDDGREGEESSERRYTDDGSTDFSVKPGPRGGSDEGRHPANVVFDESAGVRLDGEVGELSSGEPVDGDIQDKDDRSVYGDHGGEYEHTGFGDSGGPSRFFYTSKASRSERTEGGAIVNDHPTVKPVDLMEWLVKLVTFEGQTLLDPFCGSGTTCKAAKAVNRRFVGVEKQEKWADVARVRCGLTPEDADAVRDSDDQKGLEEFC